MKRFALLLAAVLSFAIGAGELRPVQAATLNIAPVFTGEGAVVEVQRRRRFNRRSRRGGGNAGAILGGIVAGAIIAGAVRESRHRNRRVRRRGGSHVNWCYRKYRSYRAYDNTYQPYRGGRRRCRSPYG